jgi:hypothetical protein
LASFIGSPPVIGSTSRFRSSMMSGSFFHGGPAGTGVAHPVGGPSLQVGIEFFAAAADGIDV